MEQRPQIQKSKKKLIKNLIVGVILAILAISGLVWFTITKLELFQRTNTPKTVSCSGVEYAGDFTIQLKSRQFTPEAEIVSGLKWLHNFPNERTHVILQLCESPNSSAKALLGKSDIQLLDYISSNSWFASVPKAPSTNDPALALVRWIGPILPEDKVYSGLFEGPIGGWALREGNRIALEVSFFEDVSLDDGRQILLEYDAVIIGSTSISNKVTVEIPRDTIKILATEDSIRWIDIVSPPPATNVE